MYVRTAFYTFAVSYFLTEAQAITALRLLVSLRMCSVLSVFLYVCVWMCCVLLLFFQCVCTFRLRLTSNWFDALTNKWRGRLNVLLFCSREVRISLFNQKIVIGLDKAMIFWMDCSHYLVMKPTNSSHSDDNWNNAFLWLHLLCCVKFHLRGLTILN